MKLPDEASANFEDRRGARTNAMATVIESLNREGKAEAVTPADAGADAASPPNTIERTRTPDSSVGGATPSNRHVTLTPEEWNSRRKSRLSDFYSKKD